MKHFASITTASELMAIATWSLASIKPLFSQNKCNELTQFTRVLSNRFHHSLINFFQLNSMTNSNEEA
jgi:hypothetical protein